jgi:hypothetical protein
MDCHVQGQSSPADVNFVRQGVRRLIFDEDQSIPLAKLEPGKTIGLSSMHPIRHYLDEQSDIFISENKLVVQSERETQTGIWLGGFNPFATYTIDLASCAGEGDIGFEFSDAEQTERFLITVGYNNKRLTGVKLSVMNNDTVIVDESIATNMEEEEIIRSKIILQMLGSGLVLYTKDKGLPAAIGQSDFNFYIDLRKRHYIHSFQSNLFMHIKNGQVSILKVESNLTTGIGLADIRAITYENGDPLLDQGRLWYMDPTVFDIKLEGIILFDRNDGLLRNEIASHIFFDRGHDIWRGLTTGFSAYANPEIEKKQLLAIESKRDPRFGFSIMSAVPFGMVGDIEDPHIIFDAEAEKWRMLTCENQNGYKAIINWRSAILFFR